MQIILCSCTTNFWPCHFCEFQHARYHTWYFKINWGCEFSPSILTFSVLEKIPPTPPECSWPHGCSGSSTAVLWRKREETEHSWKTRCAVQCESGVIQVYTEDTQQTQIPSPVFDIQIWCLSGALNSPEQYLPTAEALGRWLAAWIHLSSATGIAESRGFSSRGNKRLQDSLGTIPLPYLRQPEAAGAALRTYCFPEAACFS